jgi:HSP20 family protein
MTLVKWNPTRALITDFDRMLNGVFNDGWNTTPTIQANALPVDITENEKIFTLSADFPGFDKKDVNLSVEEGVLTLSANCESENESKNYSFRIRERRGGSFNRRFSLPENVLAENISAKFKNGTLTVSIPKVKEVKPDIRQIKIS